MSVSLEEVRQIAALARLDFEREDMERMADEMGRVLDYVTQLEVVDVSAVEPLFQVLQVEHVLRTDTSLNRISRAEALRSANHADEQFFRVPKVID